MVSALDVHKMLGIIQYMAPLVPRGRIRFRPITVVGQRSMGPDNRRLGSENYHARLGHSSSVLVGIASSVTGTFSQNPRLISHCLQTHILEMEPFFCAICGFLNKLHGHVVRLMCDNATVVSYLKQECGIKSFRLTRLTIRLLKFCDRKGIVIVPVHLPGRCNTQADGLSRPGQTLPTEWEIHPDLLRPVFNHWGQPWMDLFNNTFNNKK